MRTDPARPGPTRPSALRPRSPGPERARPGPARPGPAQLTELTPRSPPALTHPSARPTTRRPPPPRKGRFTWSAHSGKGTGTVYSLTPRHAGYGSLSLGSPGRFTPVQRSTARPPRPISPAPC